MFWEYAAFENTDLRRYADLRTQLLVLKDLVVSSAPLKEFVFVKGDGEGIVDPDGEIEAETI